MKKKFEIEEIKQTAIGNNTLKVSVTLILANKEAKILEFAFEELLELLN